MGNSADIRRENKRSIYRVMLDGGQYTKNQISRETGLSVATCNTLLNDMQAQGLVTGGEKAFGEVGRSSVLYQIDKEHESYLALHFVVEQGVKMMETIAFSAVGAIIFQEKNIYEAVTYDDIKTAVCQAKEMVTNLRQIIVGVPGIETDGVISHCDLPELNGLDLQHRLEKDFHVKAELKNDMHFKALGYYKLNDNPDDVITLAYYPSHVLPGTATIHKGMIISGANCFAGMAGFLPYNMSREEQLALLEPQTCVPFITMSICAIIVLLNPSTIVLTGDLVNGELLAQVKRHCLNDIPEEFMPQFVLADNFDTYYFKGMYELAVDRKEF